MQGTTTIDVPGNAVPCGPQIIFVGAVPSVAVLLCGILQQAAFSLVTTTK
jgi:hypothetical protein